MGEIRLLWGRTKNGAALVGCRVKHNSLNCVNMDKSVEYVSGVYGIGGEMFWLVWCLLHLFACELSG